MVTWRWLSLALLPVLILGCSSSTNPEVTKAQKLGYERRADLILNVRDEVTGFLGRYGLVKGTLSFTRVSPGVAATMARMSGYLVEFSKPEIYGEWQIVAYYSDLDLEPTSLDVSLDLKLSEIAGKSSPKTPVSSKGVRALCRPDLASQIEEQVHRDLVDPHARSLMIPGATVAMGPIEANHRKVTLSMRYPIADYAHVKRRAPGDEALFAAGDLYDGVAFVEDQILARGDLVCDTGHVMTETGTGVAMGTATCYVVNGGEVVGKGLIMSGQSGHQPALWIQIDFTSRGVGLLKHQYRGSTSSKLSLRQLNQPAAIHTSVGPSTVKSSDKEHLYIEILNGFKTTPF